MGRVTIFAIDDCPFCIRAKKLLSSKGVEYYEINLTDYPQKRPDMLKIAKALTVPQIFFNEELIGGASDLEALEKNGQLDALLEKTFKSAIEPTDVRLFRPNVPPAPKPKPSPRKHESVKVGDTELSVLEALSSVRKALGPSFSGKALVEFGRKGVARAFSGESREYLTFGKQLLEIGLIREQGRGEEATQFDESKTYVLRHEENPLCLNNLRAWQDRVDEPVLLITILKKQLGKVISKHRNDKGLVDYAAVNKDPDFLVFEEASCELQHVDMGPMAPEARLAFLINVYNTAIIHAFSKVGAPKNGLQRAKFFPTVGYNIGGHFYSFDALESGLLRGNRPGPGKFSGPIPIGDPRRSYVFGAKDIDNRIHFSLNCGAKACPPVKVYSKEAIKDELAIVSKAFFQQKDNFRIDGNTIYVSMILKWYGSDFGKSNEEIARSIAEHVSDEDSARIEAAIKSGKLAIRFNHYDWTNDAATSPANLFGSACVIS